LLSTVSQCHKRKFLGANTLENESTRAISLQEAKVPGSELASILLADSLLGAANWPGSEKAVNLNDYRLHLGFDLSSVTQCHFAIWLYRPYHKFLSLISTISNFPV